MPDYSILELNTDFREFCNDEYKDYVVYSILSVREKNLERKKILEDMASQEYGHYMFWSRFMGDHGIKAKVGKIYILAILLIRKIFGLVFTLKLLESHESRTIQRYKSILNNISEEYRYDLERLIRDEEEHERYLLDQIDEPSIKYVGFIALGLADAIIEVMGVNTGFLGVTNITIVAGIAGLIVGFAASISMAVASYLQARTYTLREVSPIFSALTTGLSYIGCVVGLTLPYFIFREMIYAFASSLAICILLTSVFTFYTSIINERNFVKELAQSILLILGTALATFFFGDLLGRALNIREGLFSR